MRDDTETRSYIEHFNAEHRRLHSVLSQARAAMRSAAADAPSAELVKMLRQLRDELERHFAEEEAGGCMDQAVSYCPRLSSEVRRIEAEHPDLLQTLDRLIAQVSAVDKVSPVDKVAAAPIAVRDQFDDLCRRLRLHEAAENEVLRQGFGANISP